MLRPVQIHFHPSKPAIYMDYGVNSTSVSDTKLRRRLIPIRGLSRSKKETHDAAALAEKLLLRHTDLLAHVGRERLRVIVHHAIGIATNQVAGEFDKNAEVDHRGNSNVAEPKSEVAAEPPASITESTKAEQHSRPATSQKSSVVGKPFVIDGNTDLNKLGDTELRQIKQELDKEFDKIRIKPDDLNFVYDRRIEFSKEEGKDDNDWDADDESEVGYIPTQPHPTKAQAPLVQDSLTVKPVAPAPTTNAQPANAPASIVSSALTIPESPSMADLSPQASPHFASIPNFMSVKKEAPASEIFAPSPIASSPAASVISELPCEDIPSQLSSAAASPVHVPLKSPAADPVAESPSLIPPSPVAPAIATESSLAPIRQLTPGGITILPADPIPEDAYEDDFSDFAAGETASHVSSKSSYINHSRSSTHQSAADIEVGATDSEHESDADEEEQGSSSRAEASPSKAAPSSPSVFPTLFTAAAATLVGANNERLKPVAHLVSMHEVSDIEEDIDEEIEVFEDESEVAHN